MYTNLRDRLAQYSNEELEGVVQREMDRRDRAREQYRSMLETHRPWWSRLLNKVILHAPPVTIEFANTAAGRMFDEAEMVAGIANSVLASRREKEVIGITPF